jgi:hypothetical protein
MALPVYKGAGGLGAGTSTVSTAQGLTMPSGGAAPVADDILLLFCSSENQAITLSTPQGFAEVTNSPQGTGTAGSTGSVRLAVFWKRAVGSDAVPVIADAGDHVTGQILCFSGCINTGNPWDTTAGDVASSTSTSVTIPGGTTSVNDCLIVMAVANSTDTTTAQTAVMTNASLANIAERVDANSTAGLGGGVGVDTGEKTIAGTVSATTTTLVSSSLQGRMMIALKPANSNTVALPGVGAPVFAGFAAAALLTIRIATGLSAPVFTGFAPTVAIQNNIVVTPGLGQPVFAGQSPAVQIGSNTVIQPGTGAPVFAGQAPTILVTVKIPIGLGQPVFTGLAPTVAISNNQRASPGVGAPVVTGFAPSVVAAVTAKPGTGQSTFAGFTPSLVFSDNQRALPGIGQPVFVGLAPTVLIGTGQAALATPGRGQPTFNGFSPLVLGSLWDMLAKHQSVGILPSPHRSTGHARTFAGISRTRDFTIDNDQGTIDDALGDISESPGMG